MRTIRMMILSIVSLSCVVFCSGCIGGIVGVAAFGSATANVLKEEDRAFVVQGEYGVSQQRSFNYDYFSTKEAHSSDRLSKRVHLSTARRQTLLFGMSSSGSIRTTPLLGFAHRDFTVEVDGTKAPGRDDVWLLGGEVSGDIANSTWHWRLRYLWGYGNTDMGPLNNTPAYLGAGEPDSIRTSQVLAGIGTSPFESFDITLGVAMDTVALPHAEHVNDALLGGDNSYTLLSLIIGISYKF